MYREAPLQIADGKIPSVKLSGLSTGDYQIFVTDELNQVYTWKFVVQDKVDGKLTYQQDKMRIIMKCIRMIEWVRLCLSTIL